MVAGTLVNGHSIPYSRSLPKVHPEQEGEESDPVEASLDNFHVPHSSFIFCIIIIYIIMYINILVLPPSLPLSQQMYVHTY